MNILIATDGSEFSDNALDFVLRFPFPPDSNMTVLTVVKEIPMSPAELASLDKAQSQALHAANQRLREEAEETVTREGSRLRADGWPGETLVRSGKPVDEILKAAREMDADLIVVGTHGTTMTTRFLLGSVSGRVLAQAPCSVLIVKKKSGDDSAADIEPGTNAPYSIMLAYDISDASQAALDQCASLPLEENSEICVISVMPMITAYRQDVRQHINDIWLQKKKIMKAELEKAVKSLQWATPNLKTQLREAKNVSEDILLAAEEAGSDLIMVGAKDKGSIERFLLGSITQRMARYATCSVWAVRKKNGKV